MSVSQQPNNQHEGMTSIVRTQNDRNSVTNPQTKLLIYFSIGEPVVGTGNDI